MSTIRQHFIPLNIHPIFLVAIAYFAGIILQAHASLQTGVIIYIFCATLLSYGAYFEHISRTLAITLLASSMLGGVLYQRQLNNHASFYKQTTEPYDAHAVVTNIEKIEHPHARYCITLDTDNIKNHGDLDWRNMQATVQIYIGHRHGLQVADHILIRNLSSKKAKNNDFERYLIKEGINATLFMHKLDFDFLERPQHSFSRFVHEQRTRIIHAFKKKLSRNSFALVTSIFLGYKATIKKTLNNLKEPFKLWGVSHYLARSGLHLVIFVAIWAFVLNKLPIIFWLKELFILLLCSLYFLLSWSSISFIRALALFIGYKTCTFTRVRPNFLHLLTLVSCAVVLYNPCQLFFLDFQLSFGLTLALAWIGNTQTQATALTKS